MARKLMSRDKVDVEIVCSDSVQLYDAVPVLTNRHNDYPCKTRLFSQFGAFEKLSVHDYSRHVEHLFAQLDSPKVLLVDGGSPFYVKALLQTYHKCING